MAKCPSVPVLWKMAALMELCPADVQDMVCQTIDGVHEDYERLKQKILSWASNKMSHRKGPVPMDVGRVDGRDSTFEFGVDAIGNNSHCYNCGAWGHASRLDKGVGKGGKGGKGGGDGGTTGKGKGYQGTCYTCGKVGHKAWECRARNVNAVQEESEGEMEEVVDVGAIWNVGHVETVDVMAVVGGEPPTSADEAEAARRQIPRRERWTNLNTSAGWERQRWQMQHGVPRHERDQTTRFGNGSGKGMQQSCALARSGRKLHRERRDR